MAGPKTGQIFWKKPYSAGLFYGRLRYWLLVLGAYEQEDVRHRAKGSGHFKLVPRTTGQLETRLDANGEAGKNGKRIRRWVARDAAIALRELHESKGVST